MAAVRKNIHKSIKDNQLVTDGIYSCVRNPIYSAFMFLYWGILLLSLNILVIVAMPLYVALMTVMVKKTEEKWLSDLYGEAYEAYCQKVNRCLPWKRRR